MKKYICMTMCMVLFVLMGCSEQEKSEPVVSTAPVPVNKGYAEKDISDGIRDKLTVMDIVVSNCFVNQKEQYSFFYKTINEENLQETIYQYSYDEVEGWKKEQVSWWDKIKDTLGKGYSLSAVNYGMDLNLYALFCNNTDGLVYELYKINEETDEVKKVELTCLGRQEDMESMPVYVGAFASGNVLVQKANGEITWYDVISGEQVGGYSGMSHKLFMGYVSFFAVDNLNTQIVEVSENKGEASEIFSLKDEVLLSSDSAGTELHVEVSENWDEDVFVMVPTGIYKINRGTKKSEKLILGSESKAIGSVGYSMMGLVERNGNLLLMSQEAIEEGVKLYASEYVKGE